ARGLSQARGVQPTGLLLDGALLLGHRRGPHWSFRLHGPPWVLTPVVVLKVAQRGSNRSRVRSRGPYELGNLWFERLRVGTNDAQERRGNAQGQNEFDDLLIIEKIGQLSNGGVAQLNR